MASVKVLFNGETVIVTTLEKDIYVLGRQDGCDIKIDNLGVSRNHSRIIRDGSNWAVEDLKSANGTFVNGQQINRQILKDGDVVTISKYEIIYSSGGDRQAEGSSTVRASVSSMDFGMDANLNTMAMDGEQLRKKFEEMNLAAGEKGGNPGSKTSIRHNEGSVELNAKEAEIAMLKKEIDRNRTILAVAIGLVTLLAVGAILLYR